MAITAASFVPENRDVKGPDNYTLGMAKNVDASPQPDTGAEQHASWESYPQSVIGARTPATTGAGKGSIMKGGRRGK